MAILVKVLLRSRIVWVKLVVCYAPCLSFWLRSCTVFYAPCSSFFAFFKSLFRNGSPWGFILSRPWASQLLSCYFFLDFCIICRYAFLSNIKFKMGNLKGLVLVYGYRHSTTFLASTRATVFDSWRRGCYVYLSVVVSESHIESISTTMWYSYKTGFWLWLLGETKKYNLVLRVCSHSSQWHKVA